MISQLAITPHDLRRGTPRVLPVCGLVVHTTGRGPAVAAKKLGIPADERALAYYLHGRGGFPHYLVDYDGDCFAVCDEGEIANHAGWAGIGGAKAWRGWTPPAWWRDNWSSPVQTSPLDLIRRVHDGARTPNAIYLGVELLADETGFGFTPEQYLKLAMLWVDLCAREEALRLWLPFPTPHARLLGHEDVNPIERASGGRPWDPGAHRTPPMFSWARLQAVIRRCGPLP
jgi:hypothetical protein